MVNVRKYTIVPWILWVEICFEILSLLLIAILIIKPRFDGSAWCVASSNFQVSGIYSGWGCEPVEVWDDHTSHNLLMAAIKRQHNHNKHQGMLQNLLPRIYHLGFNCWNLRLNKCLTKYLPSSTCASPILNTQPGIQLVYIYISPFQSSKLHPFVWRKWLGITRNCQGYFFDRVLSLPF